MSKSCLSCEHHGFDVKRGFLCNHPQRPAEHKVVQVWTRGCPQHTPISATPFKVPEESPLQGGWCDPNDKTCESCQ